MAIIQRKIIEISMEELTDVDRAFARHAQVNMDKLPKAYAGLVEKTREACMKAVKPAGVVRSVKIREIREESILLEGDGGRTEEVRSTFITELMRDCFEAVWFAATLNGFRELLEASGDLMEQFFLEAWGSAFASRAAAFTSDYARELLNKEGLCFTSAWEPGQHGFDIHNQQTAFELLRPEEIGLTLTESMLMIPAKSVTGLFGIAEKEQREMIPCDYCELRAACPSAYDSGAGGGFRCGGDA
ncbi:vitamin B12 dependent-methionine synthase activation domain-containing protein [Bacilliculturomica massiliensis]|uniref:vitamin B12 dependent-methionine synthase activation domain-containing protein n=1 Tax=Bacilliculturomica massiliensis TaxID=1917867 RepID=UPI0013EF0991|nr:vitamin B12 dependent-methionine synthase activation domain-containing protein [Bacilliculturomica massiliensis]